MKLNPEDIPYEYAHCFATDEQCPQRSSCLHALVASLPLKTGRDAVYVTHTVDPRYVTSLKGKGGCKLYRTTAPRTYARGMSQLFDAVPGKVLTEVRRRVQSCFSCRSYYFICRKGERLIFPKEQAQIAAIFQRLCPGIQPVYDSLEEAYEW